MLATFRSAFASLGEEFLQDHDAIVLKHALGDFAPVVQIGSLDEVPKTTRAAALRIRAAKDHTAHTAMHDGTCAHRARLLRDVKITISKPPVADGTLRLRESQHLGVRGGIFERLDLIPGSGDHFALMHDDRTDWHLVLPGCFLSLSQCLAHVVGVIRDENVGLEAHGPVCNRAS